MPETIITNGIILKEQTTGEKDRLVTALTADIGLIHGFVNGAKSVKSKNGSATDLFCYSKLTIIRSSTNSFTFREATPIEVFFPLRQDIGKLALAQYLAELATELSEREGNSADTLRVLLNSFYLICNGKKNNTLIKAAAELRLLTISGYMPGLVGCDNCGKYESETMFFNPKTGLIWCDECRDKVSKGSVQVGLGVITAMRHICFSDLKKMFSCSLPDESLNILGALSEEYTRSITGRRFKTLEFYKEMTF